MSRWSAPILSVLLACGPALPPASTLPDDVAFGAPAGPAGVVDDATSVFVVLPGDTLSVRVIALETSETTLAVDPEGSVTVPMAGRVRVSGLTLPAAERAVEGAVRAFDRHARVTVHMSDTGGHRVTVLGAVERPGVVLLKGELRLAEALAQVGGPRMREEGGQSYDAGDLDAAVLVRGGTKLPVSLGRALEGDPRHNVRLSAGDHVFVPAARGRQISVLGEVKNPRTVMFVPGLRLSAVLAAAGGTTRNADDADVRIVRGPLHAPRIYQASLQALVAGEARDVALAPGDIVYVTEHWFASATDVVQRLTPALLTGAVVGAAAR